MTRQQSSMRALKRLGADRCVSFLRAAGQDIGCLAIEIINGQLDKGRPLETLLGEPDSSYSLHVTRLDTLRFRIAFGCSPGPMIGDGGEWEVVFDEDGRVVECRGETQWIS